MEIETRTAATQLGVSQRQVQRMAQSGRVAHRTVAGRTVVAGRSLVAASRSSARGRHWDDATVRAACDLLEHGSTHAISGSQRSRLRARVRAISLAELAYQVLDRRVTIWRKTQGGVRSTAQIADGLTSTGGGLDVVVTPKAAAYARRLRMLEDLEGDSIVIELDTDATAVVEDIALYAYGDERTSSAARQRIRARQIALS
jgi:hypothetical protein